ncbi:competence protein ComEA [Bifidobacterium sp. SMA15]|uniref:Competence protein ComEA n=2 Tax=Bifidobacterium platyrrhinorum TaxID=2661628 RepID=A0A6L9SQN0_9BIFI|nr:competence protein ComEA [Bifidobacterium platyrrhinorum]
MPEGRGAASSPVPLPDGSSPVVTLAALSGVRDRDMDERFSARARHGRPRLRFGAKHALAAILLMVMVTCASLTLLVLQSMNHTMLTDATTSGIIVSGSDGGGEDDVSPGDGPDGADGVDGGGSGNRSSGAAGTANDAGDQTVGADASEAPAQPADTRLDLNTATLEQLDAIKGIGPVIAQRILDHRAAIGRFTSVDQLLDVPGIGAKTLEKIRPEVRV